MSAEQATIERADAGFDARFEAAVDAAGAEQPEADESAAKDEPEPAEADKDGAEPDEPAEDETGADKDGEDKEEKDEDDKDDKDKEGKQKRGTIFKRLEKLRRREKELDQRDQGLQDLRVKADALMADIKARHEQVSAAARLVELARTDPDKAFGEFARLAGMSDTAWYERVTRARLRDGGQAEVSPELAELRAEIRALRDERERERAEAEQSNHKTALERALQADVDMVCALADSPDKWPNASLWPPERLKAEATRAIRAAYDSGRQLSGKDIADQLERMAYYETEHATRIREARSKRPGSQSRVGRGHPVSDASGTKPAGRAAVSGLSNRDNASGSGKSKRDLSWDERFDLIASEHLT